MKNNMGITDKVVRIVIALIIVGLYTANLISGSISIALLILAGAFVVTSFISFCPLYYPFRISTKKKGK